MRITTFFKKILRLNRTIVESAQFSEFSEEGEQEAITIRVRPRWKRLRCGHCGGKAKGRHGKKGKIRRWQHLSVLGVAVYLVCRIYRVHCGKCGVKTMQIPWARVGSIFTRTFEDEVAWFMQKTNQTATAKYFGISWPTAGKIARRVVKEMLDDSLLDNLRFIGVDEVSYGRPRKFLTVVVDHQKHRIVWGAEGQSSATLTAFFEKLTPPQREKIEVVSIDMDAAFEKAIRQSVPKAEIIYDRFHIVALASKAVDEVRREEVRVASVEQKTELKSSRWPLLKGPWNLTLAEREKLSTIQKINKRLYRAYLLKETALKIFEVSSVEKAQTIFSDWFGWARRSRLSSFERLALTLRNHLTGILKFIEYKITNGPVEGFNSKIRMISHRAFGFHSAKALIAMLMLNCSGITIQPIGY